MGYPAKAICLASSISCSFCFTASWCCRSLAISLLLGTWSSGIARYFWIVLGEECSNNAISDMVSPSLRFSWANFIRNDRFAVLYNAFISSVMLSVNGISTLAGNSRNIYLQITSESPFIKWKRSLICMTSGWEFVAADAYVMAPSLEITSILWNVFNQLQTSFVSLDGIISIIRWFSKFIITVP